MTNPNNPYPYGPGYRQARVGNVGQVATGVHAPPTINQNVIQQVPPQPPQSLQIPQTSGYQALLQALAAKQAMDQSGRFRDSARGTFIQEGKAKSALLGGSKSAIAGRKEDQAYDAMKEAARLEADDKELQMEEKRRVLFEYYKSLGMDPDQAAIRAKVEAMGLKAGGPEAPKMNDVNSLQTQISKAAGDMKGRSEAIRDIYSYAQGETAFSDHALIFRYMKFLDPNSTVREGEFATVQNSGGIPDIARNMYNRALEGDKLSPQQRDDLVTAVVSAYPGYIQDYAQSIGPYVKRAQQFGVDLGTLDIYEPWMPPQEQGETPPEPPPGYEVVKKDGKWTAVKK